MGLQAVYTMVDEATLDELVDTDPDDLVGALETLIEKGAAGADVGKTWDGLHFVLTGVSAASPIEDDPLSEAVVGVHVFDAKDHVGCTEVDELPAVVAALEAFDWVERLATLDVTTLDAAGIHPNIWTDDPDALKAELTVAFDAVLAVHREALAAGRHLIVSIL